MRSPEILWQIRLNITDEQLILQEQRYNSIYNLFINGPLTNVSTWYDATVNRTAMRGNMNRQGTITDLGIADYEANGEIRGSLAIKVRIADDKVRIDLRIVNEAGGILAEWEGVDVIDDSQITWCFSDVGDIKLVMNPIIEPDA